MRGRKPTIQDGMIASLLALKLPPPPRHLPKSAKEHWLRVVASLHKRGLTDDDYLPVVTSYVFAQWQVDDCAKALVRDGQFKKSRDGSVKRHPACSNLKQATDSATRLAAELGLTPASRARKGMADDNDGASAEDIAALGI